MPSDIIELDSESMYSSYQKIQYDLCSGYYDINEYMENLELFYKEEYTHK